MIKFKVGFFKHQESQELDQKVCFTVFALSLFYASFFVFINTYYNDDLSRTFEGSFYWYEGGRPISEVFFRLLSQNWSKISNPSGIYQLGAGLALGYAGLIFTENFFPYLNRFSKTILSLAFLTNPYFLQNLSYNFDSITMSLSVVCTVFAVVFCFAPERHRSLVITSIALIATCCLYQYGISLFMPLVIIVILDNYRQTNRVDWKKLFQSLTVFILSTSFYTLVIAKNTFSEDSSQLARTLPFNLSTLIILNQRIDKLYERMTLLGQGNLGICYAILGLFAVAMLAKMIWELWISNKGINERICSTLFIFTAPLVILLSTISIFIFVTEDSFSPRYFIGFGGVVYFIYYSFLTLLKNRLRLLALYPILLSFTLCASYTNLLKHSYNFTKFLGQKIINDLTKHQFDNQSQLTFLNSQPLSPEVNSAVESFAFYDILLPHYLTTNTWHAKVFMNQFLIFSTDPKPVSELTGENMVIDNYYYQIFKSGRRFSVRFNKMYYIYNDL